MVPDRSSQKMPVLFVGHGSPMNALEENVFSRVWRELGCTLPVPAAILCISAHWETAGTRVTAMSLPPTIHDFGGFPEELFAVRYPAPGCEWLTDEIKTMVPETADDFEWGFDHGCWSVLNQMYPDARIPVVELCLDTLKTTEAHYATGRKLLELRNRNVLIIGSGNMVHNLRRVVFDGNDFNRPFGFDWTIEANDLFKMLITGNQHNELIHYKELGASVQLAVPTPEHFLPLLYVLAMKEKGEKVRFFNDQPVGGSLTMTSFVVE